MDNFEEENLKDDCEIEFSELPLEEAQASQFWVKFGDVLLDSSHLLAMLRTWLLSEAPRNKFADGSSKDDIELAVVDLPPARFSRVSGALTTLGSRLSPRKRLWRLATAGSTVLLALLLVLGIFPSTRAWVSSPFVHPAPTLPVTYALKQESSQIEIIGYGPDSPPLAQATAIFWDTNATPGPAPQGQSCLAEPVRGLSDEVGGAPVWIVGFGGPGATLHLSPTPLPVSAFPNKFGWAAAITLEIQSSYTGLITLSGGSRSNDLPLVLGFGLDPSQGQLFSIALGTQQPVISPGPPSTFKARRTAWNITIYVPAAGCYFLRATWPGGGWIINFAAGQ